MRQPNLIRPEDRGYNTFRKAVVRKADSGLVILRRRRGRGVEMFAADITMNFGEEN